MSSNPYALDGFGEGFERGLRIIQTMDERKYRQAKEQRDTALFGLQSKQAELGITKEQKEIANLPTPEQAQAERQAGIEAKGAEAVYHRSEAGLNTERIKNAQRDRKLSDLEGYYDAADSTADLLEKPGWLESGGEAADVFLNGQNPKPGFQDRMFQWVNDTYSDEINKGVGEKIGSYSAKQHGIPADATIVSKRVNGFHQDQDNPGMFAASLDVAAKDKNGKVYHYTAPVTKNRSGEADDAVVMIPADKLQSKLKGAYALRAGVAAAHMQGVPLNIVAAQIRNHKEELGKKGKGGNAGKPSADMQAATVLGKLNHPEEKDPDRQQAMGLQDFYDLRQDKGFQAEVNKDMDDNHHTREEAEQAIISTRAAGRGQKKPAKDWAGWSATVEDNATEKPGND